MANATGHAIIATMWRTKAKDDNPAGEPLRVIDFDGGGYVVSTAEGRWRRVGAQEFERDWEPWKPEGGETCPTCGQAVTR